MKFNDIIALAKQGYTPADIKELLSLGSDEPDDTTPDVESDTEGAEPDEVNEQNDQTTQENAAPELDYKKLYEEAQEKIDKLQKENTKKNMQTDEPSAQESLNEIVKSFM